MNAVKVDWSKSVLIIEDNVDFRTVLAKQLTAASFKVIETDKASDALWMLKNQRFACILLDMKLSQGDGELVLAELVRDVRGLNHGAPVLVLSGTLDPDVLKRIGRVIKGVLVKPVASQAVIDRIQKLIDEGALAQRARIA